MLARLCAEESGKFSNSQRKGGNRVWTNSEEVFGANCGEDSWGAPAVGRDGTSDGLVGEAVVLGA